ncbi:MAG TPA: hypothetical protein VFE84_01240 [Patescibacteria group bacterium]|nr:hypothetical protein [Patescibacteria group bacterium]
MPDGMLNRVRQVLLATVACAVVAASAAALSSPARLAPSKAVEQRLGPAFVAFTPPDPRPLARPPDHVLVQLFRGRTQPSREEVSITTIFRERSFTVLGDADVAGGSEEDLKSQVREVFSLRELSSLGSSIVALSGGSAVLDDNGHRVEIHVEGQPVGGQAARLVVSEVQDGQEIVASSVIARMGKTVVLAGPPASGATGGREIDFVCLTPFR